MGDEEIRNIENRPKELFGLQYYKDLEEKPVRIDMEGSIGDFLAYDLFDLDGVQPIELRHLKANNRAVSVNPSKTSIELYKKERVKFQLVFVVVNCYGFKDFDGVLVGKPYNISLQPATKRGELSVVSPEWIEKINLEELDQQPRLFKGFNPFLGAFGIYMLGGVDHSNIESDMLGFVHGMYALAIPFDKREVSSPKIPSIQESRGGCSKLCVTDSSLTG